MNRIGVLMIALTLSVLLTKSATAQDLADGTWTGSMMPPGSDEAPVEYTVSHEDGQLAISILSAMGEFPFSDIGFEDGALTFTWTPGALIECALEPQEDGSYYGDCEDEDGGIGQLRMIPPAGED